MTDPVLDSFFEDIKERETSIYDLAQQDNNDQKAMESSDEEEDITKMPLKKVIEKLYERIKRKERRILLSKAKIDRLMQESHVVKCEFDSLKSVAESWLHEK